MSIQTWFKSQKPIIVTTAGTNAGATRTITNDSANRAIYLYDIIAWTDTTSLLTINLDEGATSPIELKLAANVPYHFHFDGTICGALAKDVTVTLATSTSDCSLSVSYEIPGDS